MLTAHGLAYKAMLTNSSALPDSPSHQVCALPCAWVCVPAVCGLEPQLCAAGPPGHLLGDEEHHPGAEAGHAEPPGG
jgi:hypothetical protein